MDELEFDPGYYDTQISEARARANEARQRSQLVAPQGSMVSGYYVSAGPLGSFASALKSARARGEFAQEQDKIKSLSGEKNQAIARALQGFQDASTVKPAALLPEDQEGPQRPAIEPDMRSAYAQLLRAPDQSLRSFAIQGMGQLPALEQRKYEREQERAFKQSAYEQAAAERRQAAQDAQAFRLDAIKAQNDAALERQRQQQEFTRALKQMGGGTSASYMPFQTSDGWYSYDKNSGKYQKIMTAEGKPLLPISGDAALQSTIASAKEAAKQDVTSATEAKKEIKGADQFINQANRALEILSSPQGPTASGLGAVRDAAGRIVGVSSNASQKAAELESIGAWLTGSVPRFEGPQSDADRQYYIQQAGRVGDRTVPVNERIAALNEVMRLQKQVSNAASKRAGLQPGNQPPQAPGQPGNKRIRFDAQGNIIP